MEIYLTIEKLAGYLKLAVVQTIRRYVLHGEIPFHKIWRAYTGHFLSKNIENDRNVPFNSETASLILKIRRQKIVLKIINRRRNGNLFDD